MAMPSIFSSQQKSTSAPSPASRRSMRLPHACSSSKEKALSSDIIGTRCSTGANSAVATPLTFCVGESGVRSHDVVDRRGLIPERGLLVWTQTRQDQLNVVSKIEKAT